jgi:triosephosphate isomerase
MAIFIRKTLVGSYGDKAMNTKIIYGGSIDETNARDMRENGDVVGFILGRASSDAEKFTALIRSLA